MAKTAVVGANDRATNQVATRIVMSTDKETLQVFLKEHAAEGAKVYMDEARAYKRLPVDHEAVKHSVSEYVRGQAHTNGMASFLSILKCAHDGIFHNIYPKHLHRYEEEFSGKHIVQQLGTLVQITRFVAGIVGKKIMHRSLIADNWMSSGARS